MVAVRSRVRASYVPTSCDVVERSSHGKGDTVRISVWNKRYPRDMFIILRPAQVVTRMVTYRWTESGLFEGLGLWFCKCSRSLL